MECNKDEAVRARGVAEERLQSGDYPGARKMALKAQRLFPDLENLSRILTVCEVHSSAQSRVCGSDLDWYGILQVGQQADEMTIKKQYRKLALSLHPDKNKFAGAEAAFKFIGDAHRVLSDHTKRCIFDSKYRIWTSKQMSQPHLSNGRCSAVSIRGNVKKPKNASSSQENVSKLHQQTQPSTFWTSCLFCHTKYEHYRAIINRIIQCGNCLQNFVACELGAQDVPLRAQLRSFHGQKNDPTDGAARRSQSRGENISNATIGKAAENRAEEVKEGKDTVHSRKHDPTLEASRRSQGRGENNISVAISKAAENKVEEIKQGKDTLKPETALNKGSAYSAKINGKRVRKQRYEDGSETESDNSFHVDGDSSEEVPGQRNTYARRSSRKRQNVSYMEEQRENYDNLSANEEKSKSSDLDKEAYINISSDNTNVSAEATDLDNKDCKPEVGDNCNSKSNVENTPEIIVCPDSEFNDFDKVRGENCFFAGQFWALYDTQGSMPRFYARISKVLSPGKLRITWLEANPDSDHEHEWLSVALPVACGKYKLGEAQITTDLNMFSHQMHCSKITPRGPFYVYPKKGETWALFKDWSIDWSFDPTKHIPFKYEYAEVLSDFVEGIGVTVTYLDKVNGFVSLFQQTKQNGVVLFQISPKELYRFSHRIPSFRMTGAEGDDVPANSFEFDPASLPLGFFGEGEGIVNLGAEASGSCPKKMNSSTHAEKICTPENSKSNNVEMKPLSRRRTSRISIGNSNAM